MMSFQDELSDNIHPTHGEGGNTGHYTECPRIYRKSVLYLLCA